MVHLQSLPNGYAFTITVVIDGTEYTMSYTVTGEFLDLDVVGSHWLNEIVMMVWAIRSVVEAIDDPSTLDRATFEAFLNRVAGDVEAVAFALADRHRTVRDRYVMPQ